MSLATEETVTKTHWRGADGTAYTSQRWAEVNSIAYLTGFVHCLEDLDNFLKKLCTHYDTKQWLLEQLDVQPGQPLTADQLANVLNIAGRRSGVKISNCFDLAREVQKLLYAQPAEAQFGNAIPNTGATLQDLPSKLYEYYDKRNWASISESKMFREVGIMLEQDGYQLIKK